MPVRLESPDQPEVLRLIDELDKYQKPLYPPESHHGIDIAALMRPEVLFAVARTDEGTAVGCGAIVLGPEYGEIKRMFVAPSARGRGVGKQLLNFLEVCAGTNGCPRFVLETGCLQSNALSLYLQSGYARCGPFGSYSEDPNSVFLYKNAV
jgi:putative acetyltransferase